MIVYLYDYTSYHFHYIFSGSGIKSPPMAQYSLGGDIFEVEVPPKSFYPAQFYLPESRYVKFNVSVVDYAVAGIYGRRNVPPTHVQYGFFQVADGNRLARSKRAIREVKCYPLTIFSLGNLRQCSIL